MISGGVSALIGYSGFVGSNLQRQFKFEEKYNSSNIDEIENRVFDLVICAGVSGTKWLANKYPEEDLRKIKKLLGKLSTIKAKKLVLISTVDVYRHIDKVDENHPIILDGLHYYGRNRALVEEFVKDSFDDYNIIRLPAIYGHGIKKNFVYDLLNDHCLEWTHKDSVFQYYNLKNLWRDIEIVIYNGIKVVNFNSEPVGARELAKISFGIDFDNVTDRPPVRYDIRSYYTDIFNKNSVYMYDKKQIFREMDEFIKDYHSENNFR